MKIPVSRRRWARPGNWWLYGPTDDTGWTFTQLKAILSSRPPISKKYYSSRNEGQKKRAWAVGEIRPIVVIRVRFLRCSHNKVIMSWQVISIPASQYHKIKWVEDERDGILESVAEVIEDPVWDLLMSGWRTVDPGDFAALAEAISSLQDELRNYVIADPLKSLDAALGFSDLSLLGAITEHVPIPGLDQSLGEIKQYLEIAGIILVAISGGHILACASFKMWAHDELGRLLGKLLNKLLHNLCEGPEE